MESTSHKSRFLGQINNSFGSGGMSLAFNEVQFSSFVQFLKLQSRGQLTIQKAVTIIGQQPGVPLMWVLGKDLHIDGQGSTIEASERTHMWMDLTLQAGLGSITLQEFLPTIASPLGTEVLRKLVVNLRIVMCHNFLPAILVAAGAVMSLHYQTIIQSGGCPTVVAAGESQTGRTTALRVGLSLMVCKIAC